MPIDAGGARMRERDMMEEWERRPQEPSPSPDVQAEPKPTVTVSVTETHDGEGCECIDASMTLCVGDTLELTHTCHDGRVDKVIGKITAIDAPRAPEHGAVVVSQAKP